ncbi:hypothetical protein P153DRAFT_395195 [Dothidotthia symphoricarpi CBS 119687]|uniref:Uncharacterized protein n=1 Tax=Dothidotthia symphoricarpi CBS 119687 TaxID=1392245 RepID=A0A6A6AIN0_9PLEO|nr:uncharacterized protein P153DRAFT_395195 [Dothidotthia symphoricarpi CBS 119687]KAF2130767.1 hypothetical protein P153DRAFT_395195 [Dothidotthia symphoricarpi CBS 119687]
MCRFMLDNEDDQVQKWQGWLPSSVTWAMPVDITELGAILAAYSNLEAEIETLSECHQNGSGLFTQLPQEIFDQIIDDYLQAEKAVLAPLWKKSFACFMGICTIGQHLNPFNNQTQDIWNQLERLPEFNDLVAKYLPGGSESDRVFSDSEKAIIVEGYGDDRGSGFLDIWDHFERREEWLDRLCCQNLVNGSTRKTFPHLISILRSRFGLEVIICHEPLTEELRYLLPHRHLGDFFQYDHMWYTSAFLAIASVDKIDQSVITPMQQSLAEIPNLAATYSVIDPPLSEDKRKLFAQAVRLFKLRPHFHLSNIDLSVKNPGFSDSLRVRTSEDFDEYIERWSKELAKQSWPQLMFLATPSAAMSDS